MMGRVKANTILVLTLVALAVGIAACDNEPDTPGEALDNAIENTGDAVERAGEKIQDAGR